jgi:hypothetical protein
MMEVFWSVVRHAPGLIWILNGRVEHAMVWWVQGAQWYSSPRCSMMRLLLRGLLCLGTLLLELEVEVFLAFHCKVRCGQLSKYSPKGRR